MKLTTVSHYFEGHRGGVEIVAGRLARELEERGSSVTWAAADPRPPVSGPGLQTLVLGASNLLERQAGLPYPIPSPVAVLRLVAAIKRSDAVLVHDSLYLTSVTAVITARLFRKPAVVVQHIGEVSYRNPVLRLLMRTANALLAKPVLRAADQVVFISEITRRYFADVRFRRPPLLIFNGVDTTVFNRAVEPLRRAGLRDGLGLAVDAPTVLFVGRFVEKKGLHLLRALASQRPDLSFAFAGWGAQNPRAWGLPNVRVFDGRSGAALADLYRASDVLLLPSTSEGFPLVIQEALACGLPVVCGAETATADPAVRPWLEGVSLEGEPTHIASALGAAVDRALAQVDDGSARAAFARERYGWAGAADQYAGVLTRLLAQAAELNARPPVITRPAT